MIRSVSLRLTVSLLAGVLAASMAACGGGDDAAPTGPIVGDDNKYVVSDLRIPTNPAEVQASALDIDGDGLPDNKIGTLFSTLAQIAGGGSGVDLQSQVSAAVRNGSVILLVNLRATDLLNATNAGAWMMLGSEPSVAPCADEANPATCGQHLVAGTTFQVDSTSPKQALVRGQLVNGAFESDFGGKITLLLRLSDSGPAVPIPLVGTRATATVDANGLMTGVIGGALTQDALRTNVFPAVHGLVEEIVARDCSGPGLGTPPNCCLEGSTGKTLIETVFEPNIATRDCKVSIDEIGNSTLLQTLLSPDVDILEGDRFQPNIGDDKVGDSTSLGVSFSAVGGVQFALPGDLEGLE